jgi:hypothetical protein
MSMEFFVGEIVTYAGRSHTVLGVDPVGAEPQLVYLREVKSRERLTVPAEDLDDRPDGAFRLILGGNFGAL